MPRAAELFRVAGSPSRHDDGLRAAFIRRHPSARVMPALTSGTNKPDEAIARIRSDPRIESTAGHRPWATQQTAVPAGAPRREAPRKGGPL